MTLGSGAHRDFGETRKNLQDGINVMAVAAGLPKGSPGSTALRYVLK
jgi:hypothetical protein